MKNVMIPLVATALLVACSNQKIIQDSYPDDLTLLSHVAGECADSIGSVCETMDADYPLRITVLGSQDNSRMIVRSAVENACLSRDFLLTDETVDSDSLIYEIEVSVLDLGIRYREIDRRGIDRSPWVLRDARCTVAARCIAWDGTIIFSDHISSQTLDWIPGSYSVVLNDERFPPAGLAVPKSSGIIGPLAVVTAAGSLLALFFITSE
jgi:hypothetical protein